MALDGGEEDAILAVWPGFAAAAAWRTAGAQLACPAVGRRRRRSARTWEVVRLLARALRPGERMGPGRTLRASEAAARRRPCLRR
eukprot:2134356-Lingulodinium_polyedra.AAC.1